LSNSHQWILRADNSEFFCWLRNIEASRAAEALYIICYESCERIGEADRIAG